MAAQVISNKFTNADIERAKEAIWNIISKKLAEMTDAILPNNEFEYYATNLYEINDWNEFITYKCPINTMFFKDSHDSKSGIGFIYNVISPDTILIGTIGTEYINTMKNLRFKNTYYYININNLDNPKLWEVLREKLVEYIDAKYN